MSRFYKITNLIASNSCLFPFKQGKDCYVLWNPLHHGNAVEQPDPDWTVVNTRSDQATNGNAGN